MNKTQFSNDHRGSLGVIEFNNVPFIPQRFFWIANVPHGETRGHHAHRSCEQFLVVLNGTLCVQVDFVSELSETYELTSGDTLHVGNYQWLVLSDFSQDCVVGVLASEPYDEIDYIRSRAEFDAITS